MQALCLNVEVISLTGDEIDVQGLDEDVFRAEESLGIDISRPERGTDEKTNFGGSSYERLHVPHTNPELRAAND